MSSESVDSSKTVRLVVLICAIIFSFVAMILVFTTDFGWWYYGSGYSTYYYWIGSEMAPIWSQIVLVLLALIFLFALAYSIFVLILNLGKISLKINPKFTAIFGIVIAAAGFVFTAFTVGMFAIVAAEAWWGLTTSFYGALVGSILLGIFYIIYFVSIGKDQTEVVAK